jgi:hypothetical protein
MQIGAELLVVSFFYYRLEGAMNLTELKNIYSRIYVAVARESRMRAIVFLPGHPKRASKLKEIETLLADIDLLKDELKRRIELDERNRPNQAILLDAPERVTRY